MNSLKTVGHRTSRIDAQKRVTGTATYTGDLRLPDVIASSQLVPEQALALEPELARSPARSHVANVTRPHAANVASAAAVAILAARGLRRRRRL